MTLQEIRQQHKLSRQVYKQADKHYRSTCRKGKLADIVEAKCDYYIALGEYCALCLVLELEPRL